MLLLTEQEIAKISESCQGADWAYQLVRKTESALLEKLKAQEPMCWTNDTELSYSQFKRPDGELTSGSFWAEYHEDCDIPLYRYPLPPADVVQKYEELLYAVHRKFPDETRHQTALRYIKTAESPSYTNASVKEKA